MGRNAVTATIDRNWNAHYDSGFKRHRQNEEMAISRMRPTGREKQIEIAGRTLTLREHRDVKYGTLAWTWK